MISPMFVTIRGLVPVQAYLYQHQRKLFHQDLIHRPISLSNCGYLVQMQPWSPPQFALQSMPSADNPSSSIQWQYFQDKRGYVKMPCVDFTSHSTGWCGGNFGNKLPLLQIIPSPRCYMIQEREADFPQLIHDFRYQCRSLARLYFKGPIWCAIVTCSSLLYARWHCLWSMLISKPNPLLPPPDTM